VSIYTVTFITVFLKKVRILLQTQINFRQVTEDSPPPPKSLFQQTVLALMRHKQIVSSLRILLSKLI